MRCVLPGCEKKVMYSGRLLQQLIAGALSSRDSLCGLGWPSEALTELGPRGMDATCYQAVLD